MVPKLTMVDMLPTVMVVPSPGGRHSLDCCHYVCDFCHHYFYLCSGYDSGVAGDGDFGLLNA